MEKLPEGVFVSTAALLRDGPRVVLSALDRNEPVLRSKITEPGQRAWCAAPSEKNTPCGAWKTRPEPPPRNQVPGGS